jgi:hypothetical protein
MFCFIVFWLFWFDGLKRLFFCFYMILLAETAFLWQFVCAVGSLMPSANYHSSNYEKYNVKTCIYQK